MRSRNFQLLAVAAVSSVLVRPTAFATEGNVNAPKLQISASQVTGNELIVSWSGGRPSYQLQKSESLSEGWVNVGSPTDNTTAVISTEGAHGLFRVVQDYTAEYQVLFDATWSQQTHPQGFPFGSAHWSALVGGVHNQQAHFWHDGETASEGIRLMAESGRQGTLLSEVSTAITNKSAHFTLAGGGISSSPGTRVLVFPQGMRRDFPLVTLCSMIAPSPDWFVGVDSLSLLEGGEWVTAKTVELYGFDAGTDSGLTFTSPNEVTVPRGVVTRFSGYPAFVNGVVVPFGTFTFTRLD